jgi:hypothetical protein
MPICQISCLSCFLPFPELFDSRQLEVHLFAEFAKEVFPVIAETQGAA